MINQLMRWEIINTYIEKYKFKSYLEIGVQNGVCFSKVQCKKKVGVDPDTTSKATVHKTSDDFFKANKEKFDIIFIDGLHHYEQVEKDFLNAYSALSNNGVIILHDCNPLQEAHQVVPRASKVWNGNVWKYAYRLCKMFNCVTIESDCGCLVFDSNNISGDFIDVSLHGIDWDFLQQNRKEVLNLTSVTQWLKTI